MPAIIGLDDVVRIDDVVASTDRDRLSTESTRRTRAKTVRTGLKLSAAIGIFASMTLVIPRTSEATAPPNGIRRSQDATKADFVASADVSSEFERLAEEWRTETMFSSSLAEQFDHPAYIRIIELGESVLPLLLKAMRSQPDHWTHALTKITGVDPVPPDAHGRLSLIADAWIRWGKDKGLLA